MKKNADASAITRLTSLWARLSPLPGGKFAFSKVIGHFIPYSGSVGAVVDELGPSHVRIRLQDRRAVRNHLRCVHAIALANIGELASGLAVLIGLGEGTRGIVTSLKIDYRKKARGLLIAEAAVPQVEKPTRPTPHTAMAEIRDTAGDVVAVVTAEWLLSPVPAEGTKK